jgi:hypothetical protein
LVAAPSASPDRLQLSASKWKTQSAALVAKLSPSPAKLKPWVSTAKARSEALVAGPSPSPAAKRKRLGHGAAAAQTTLVCKGDAMGPPQPRLESEPVIKMLREMMEICQLACKEGGQHVAQSSMQSLVGEALCDFRADLLKSWDDAKAAKALVDEARLSAELTVQEREAQLWQSGETIEERRRGFAANAEAFKQRTRAVREAKAAQEELEAELEALAGKRALLLKAREEYLRPLMTGVDEHAKATELMESLMSALADFDIEASAKEALPEVLMEGSATCSPLGMRILRQLEDSLSRHAAVLEERLRQGEQRKAACAAAIDAAHDAFEEASARQQGGARRLWGSQSERKEAEAALERARMEVRALEEKLQLASRESAVAAEGWFRSLQGGSLAAYLSQRDQAMPLLPIQST